jgi:sulfoxide reductase heme-binding subunit YedZ
VNHEFWYLSRAAGFTAYLLLFVSVALGISMGTRLTERFLRRNTVFDLHRFTTMLALGFTLFHIYILLGDSFFNFNVWQLSVPFLSPYRAWQTAVGIGAFYVMVVVTVSFYVRQFIGYRAWRVLHYLTFVLFAASALHGITAGSDTTQAWAKLIYVATGAATLALIAYRLQYKVPDSETVRSLRVLAGFTTVVVALLLLVSAAVATSGGATDSTTTDSLTTDPQSSPARAQQTDARYPFLDSFSDQLTATYSQIESGNKSQLTIDGTTSGDLTIKLHVELETTGGGGAAQSSVTANKAQLIDAGSGQLLCDGQLSALNNGVMRMSCTGAGPYQGVNIAVTARLSADSATSLTGAVSGSMQRTG